MEGNATQEQRRSDAPGWLRKAMVDHVEATRSKEAPFPAAETETESESETETESETASESETETETEYVCKCLKCLTRRRRK